MTAPRARRPALVAAVRGIFEIPRLRLCDWQPPDYRHPPHRRAWTLPVADPRCRFHGTPGEQADAPDAQTGGKAA